MKLRNKKTGKIERVIITAPYFGGEFQIQYYPDEDYAADSQFETYNSLAELNEEWEDYKTAEPLIKDEKIRKAVRAWAEADDLDNFRVQNQHFNACKIIGYTAGINKASFIGFQTTIAHADSKKLYTIAELCGEEEE